MSTKTNYIGYKLFTNIKKVDLSGYFLPSKISDFSYSIETLDRRYSPILKLARLKANKNLPKYSSKDFVKKSHQNNSSKNSSKDS